MVDHVVKTVRMEHVYGPPPLRQIMEAEGSRSLGVEAGVKMIPLQANLNYRHAERMSNVKMREMGEKDSFEAAVGSYGFSNRIRTVDERTC